MPRGELTPAAAAARRKKASAAQRATVEARGTGGRTSSAGQNVSALTNARQAQRDKASVQRLIQSAAHAPKGESPVVKKSRMNTLRATAQRAQGAPARVGSAIQKSIAKAAARRRR